MKYNNMFGLPDGDDDDAQYDSYVKTLPKNLQGDGDYNMRRYWELNGKPKDFKTGEKSGMFVKQPDGYHAYSVAYNKDADEYEFMKSPSHPTLNKELEWYNSKDPEAVKFRSEYSLDKSGPYYKYVRKK